MKRGIALLAAVLLIAGCVGSSSHLIDNHTALISGYGNAYASEAQVQVRVMSEAAKTTIAKGFTRFTILSSEKTSRHSSYTSLSRINSGYPSAYTVNMRKPGQDIMIRMFTDADAPADSWSAGEILEVQQSQKQKKH